MSFVEGAGVALHVVESGSGPAVLLVHGMADDSTGWAGVASALAGGARVIAYDRRGYGASGAPEPYERTTVAEQAEDAAALLTALGAAPAVVCGVDIGALVALDLLLRHRDLVRGAVLVDAPAFQLVPDATEVLSAERAALEAALREGGASAAVRGWLELRGAGGDPDRIARASARPRAFFADFGGQATLTLSRRELRRMDASVVLVDGAGAPAHVRAAGDALAALLPGARRGGAEDVAAAVRRVLQTT